MLGASTVYTNNFASRRTYNPLQSPTPHRSAQHRVLLGPEPGTNLSSSSFSGLFLRVLLNSLLQHAGPRRLSFLEKFVSLAISSRNTPWQQIDNPSNSPLLLHLFTPVPATWIDRRHRPLERPSSVLSKPHREAQASTTTRRAHSTSLMYSRMQ